MKVLEINCDCGCFSTGKIVSDISTELIKNGNECLCCYGRDFKDTGIPVYKIGTKIDVYYHALMARLFDACGLFSTLATKKAIKVIQSFDPDLIHLHNIHGYYLNIKVLFNYLKTCGKPIIWTMHDCWAFTGHCSHFEIVNCNLWQSNCSKCCQTYAYPKSFFSFSSRNFLIKKQLFSMVPNLTIVTPSLWLKDKVLLSFLNVHPSIVINNGIDTNVFNRRDTNYFDGYPFKNKKVILGVASKWTVKKGINDFYTLSNVIDDKRFVIFLVGLSKQQIKTLPKNIYGISRTHNSLELANIYSSSFVLFNPTYEDTYPTVNLEAQSCGLPVITYNTGGSAESVPENQAINKGDVSSFVSLIEKEKLHVVSNIKDKKEMVADYLALFRKVLIK